MKEPFVCLGTTKPVKFRDEAAESRWRLQLRKRVKYLIHGVAENGGDLRKSEIVGRVLDSSRNRSSVFWC